MSDPELAGAARSVRERREQYETAGLDRDDLVDDPVAQWLLWYGQADAAGVVEPNAMTIATTGLDGVPDARSVLARGVDHRGITFYSNAQSPKAEQLAARPAAAVVFAWLDLHRQVRARGTVHRIAEDEADAYFAGRPRGSQIGAWASPQSQPIGTRRDLDAAIAEVEARFGDGPIPRPPFWGGWRVVPTTWEFWQGRPSRLHDRFRYTAQPAGGWLIERLAP